MTVRSYIGKLDSVNGPMLGGIRHYATSPCQTKAIARVILHAIKDINEGVELEEEIAESKRLPELFYHCNGKNITAVGSRCSECREIMTKDHAREVLRQCQKQETLISSR